MAKITANRKTLATLLGLAIALIFMSSFKGIYVNLHNAYSYRNLYNPVPDIACAAFGSILLGLILGYWLKSKR
jgi:hypothetical protein